MAQNAVAEIIGRPIDKQGRLAPADIQQRVTSLPLQHAPQRPVIAFAGGESKAAAILAVLRGQWLSGLVTDEGCARQILAWTDQAA
jgi:DNA-binding transcriptional regulator LsrR (DeoR family)